MKKEAIRTITECDFLVYLNKDLRPVGYELTLDDRKTLAARYNSGEVELEPTIPLESIFVVEIFGITTTIIILMGEDKQGEIIFYKPTMLKFAREIAENLDMAIEIMEYKPEEGEVIPKEIQDDKDREDNDKEVIARLPFTNWMTTFWNTPMWGKVWRSRTDLQSLMAEFAIARREELRGP